MPRTRVGSRTGEAHLTRPFVRRTVTDRLADTIAAYEDELPCRSNDPELWFPAGDEYPEHTITTARALCALCPVRRECAELAARSGTDHGVWGGMTPIERRRAFGTVYATSDELAEAVSA